MGISAEDQILIVNQVSRVTKLNLCTGSRNDQWHTFSLNCSSRNMVDDLIEHRRTVFM